MYAQLGNIVFEGLRGFSSFEETFGVNYAQHDRINGKPRLQAVGYNLNTISFDMFLHASFTDPEADIETLKVAMLNREVLPLILGNGKVLGNFVIPNFTKTTSASDATGNIIEATISVELLESFTEEPLRAALRFAQNVAFATKQRNSNVRSLSDPKISQGMAVTAGVSKIETSGKLVTQHVAQVEQNAETAVYYSDKISSNLDDIEKSIAEVNSRLSQAEQLANMVMNLPNALNDVYIRVQNMRAVLPISNITDFKVFNSQLQNSILLAKSANVRLSNQSILRRI